MKSKVCLTVEDIRNLVKTFEERILSFSHDAKEIFDKSVKNEQMGETDEDKTLKRFIDFYKNSNYQTKFTSPYIEHLENQINLIDTFFSFTNVTRYVDSTSTF